MSQTVLARRILGLCSSLRLAVVVMLTLAGTCAFATFYEMSHGTPAVQRDIYRTPGFALLLGLLGVNIFAVMVSRWPWKKHHTGFVIAHAGILTLLAGSLLSLHRGLDSNLPLFEGETSDRVSLLEKALQVSVPGVGSASFPVEFEKQAPSPERPQRFRLPGSDVTLVADSFLPHVEMKETFEEAPRGGPALHFSLQAPMATQDAWLAVDDPAHAHLDLGMVSFSLHEAASEAEARAGGRPSKRANHLSFVLAPDGSVFFGATGQSGAPVTGKVEPGQPVKTGWPALAVNVDRVLPHAVANRTVVPAPLPEKEERRAPRRAGR